MNRNTAAPEPPGGKDGVGAAECRLTECETSKYSAENE